MALCLLSNRCQTGGLRYLLSSAEAFGSTWIDIKQAVTENIKKCFCHFVSPLLWSDCDSGLPEMWFRACGVFLWLCSWCFVAPLRQFGCWPAQLSTARRAGSNGLVSPRWDRGEGLNKNKRRMPWGRHGNDSSARVSGGNVGCFETPLVVQITQGSGALLNVWRAGVVTTPPGGRWSHVSTNRLRGTKGNESSSNSP